MGKKPDIDVKLPELGFSGPKLSADSKVSTVDANLPNVSGDVKLDISPPVVAEEKSSKFSFGFGKKGKKKKEKSPQLPTADPVVTDLSLTDGKVVPNIGSETKIDLPSLSLEKDTDRSLV